MNKIVTILVAAMFFLVSATYSQVSLTLSPTTVMGDVGESVTVQVATNNFNDIVSLQFGVKWDPAVIRFDSVSNLNLKDLSPGNFNPDISAGFLSFSWFEASTQGTSVPDGEAIFLLNFTVLGGAGTGSAITFESRPGLQIEVVDDTGEITNSVSFTNSQFGDPNGNGGNNGGNTSPLVSSISSNSGENGTTVCVNVSVSNFTDITQMQYSLNWDQNVLQYNGIRNINLSGLSLSNFGTTNTANGTLTLDWSNTSGTTISDGTTIYQLCFDLVGAVGTNSTVAFANSPTPISVTTTASDNSVGITQSNGAITVTASNNNNLDRLINIATMQADSGETVCMPVTVNDFDGIASLQFSLQWDQSVLEFTEVKNFGLPDLVAGNFNTEQAASGRLALAWFDNTAQGVTLQDEATVFEVCFKVLGGNGKSSSIAFTDTPTSREAATANNTIPFTQTDGGITVGDGVIEPPPPPALDKLVNINTISAMPNTSICMPVTVTDFDAIASLQFSLAWDPAVLQFDEVKNFNLPDLGAGQFNIAEAANGQLALAWVDNAAQGVTLQDAATIFEVCFTVLGTNGTSSAISFTDIPTAKEAATANNIISFTQTDGQVNVSTTTTPTGSIINIGTFNPTANTSFCTPVTVKDFEDITSLNFSLAWDPAVIGYTSVQSFGLAGMTAASFSTATTNNGQLALTWTNNQGVTVADDAVIFEICYDAIGAAQASTNITFTDTPTPRAITTTSGTAEFNSTNGRVTINSVVTPPTGDGIINIDSISGAAGDNVCIPLTVKDFDAIASMQFSLAWDPMILRYTETKSFGLPDLGASNFNIDGVNSGQLAAAWFDQAAQGITLQDGTTVFEVCFDIIGSKDETTGITFTDIPTQRELANANETIEFESTNGFFTVSEGDGGGEPTTLDSLVNIAAITVQPEATFCAPIVVKNFDAIASMQFSLNWDPSVIEFTGVQAFNLPDLGAGQFNDAQSANGQLTLAWVDNAAQGVTLQDGAAIFEVCFRAIGADGTGTIIAFTDTPTQREASTANAIIHFSQNNGNVSIQAGDQCPGPVTATLASTDITCNGMDNGSITITPGGGNGTFSYQWSDSNIGNIPNPTNLAPGTYSVTVSSCGGQEIKDDLTVTLTEPTAISSVVTPQDASCFGEADGRINISVLGGTLPYSYTWNDASLSPANQPTNALAGVYSLTITDGNDCEDVTNNIVISSPTQITASVTTTDASCSGKPDGTATITPSGGSGSNYSFNWGVDGIEGGNPTNVPSGNYMVTITDGNQCTQAIAVTVDAAITIVANPQVVEDACGDSQGGIQLNPSGGTAPYSYEWAGGPITIGDTNTIENIPTGTYTVTITDDNDCSTIETIEVGGPTVLLSATADITATDCPEDDNGSIVLTTLGGFGPYSYVWSNSAVTSTINNLTVGTYTITITDSKLCTFVETYNVTSTSNMSVDITINNGAPNASVTATVTGGSGNYTYEWCDGQDTPTATGLAEGTCTLTVIDELGCTIVENIEIIADDPVPTIIQSNAIACNGGSDGILQVQTEGGNTPYNYTWSNGTTGNLLVNVAAGTYTVTVTDSNNNTGVDTFVLAEPDAIMVTENEIKPSCQNDGSIEIVISGGTTPYKKILWSNGVMDALTVEGLREGDYGVIITDQNDCTAETTIRVNPDTDNCKECYTSNKVMTPNEDGLNDVFRINCVDLATNNRLEVFNRWGQLVFEADNYQCALGTEEDCWKGLGRSNRVVDEGGYFWILEFDDNNGRRRIRDHVTILRDE